MNKETVQVKMNDVRGHKFALIFSEKKDSRSSEENEGRVIECAFEQSKNWSYPKKKKKSYKYSKSKS